MKPNMILIAERKANKLYMTDAFFFEHRIKLGVILLVASAFMLRTYFIFGFSFEKIICSGKKHSNNGRC